MGASGASALVEEDHASAGSLDGDAVVGGGWVAIGGSVPHDFDITGGLGLNLNKLNSVGNNGGDLFGSSADFERLGECAHTAGVLSTNSEVVLRAGVEVLDFEGVSGNGGPVDVITEATSLTEVDLVLVVGSHAVNGVPSEGDCGVGDVGGSDLAHSAGCTDDASAVVVNVGWASPLVVGEGGGADEDGGTFGEEERCIFEGFHGDFTVHLAGLDTTELREGVELLVAIHNLEAVAHSGGLEAGLGVPGHTDATGLGVLGLAGLDHGNGLKSGGGEALDGLGHESGTEVSVAVEAVEDNEDGPEEAHHE